MASVFMDPTDPESVRAARAELARRERAPAPLRHASAGPTIPPAAAPTPRPPCVHEGVILEPCTGCRSELRHVRACDYEGHEPTRCTRGPNSGADPDIASCATCAFWQAG